MGVRRVVFGLGSNLGDRRQAILGGAAALGESPGIAPVKMSPLYETDPVGGPPQGAYLNAALLVLSDLSPRELVATALAVEAKLGRIRPLGVRDAPRTIDIDVLWIDGERFDDGDVKVPHPRLAERAFALRPLLDVASDARDPVSRAAYVDLPAARETLRLLELT
jgi:2-amino-4-hydroxy-6-hydroxymethyldihydropteridine diphosphokinase